MRASRRSVVLGAAAAAVSSAARAEGPAGERHAHPGAGLHDGSGTHPSGHGDASGTEMHERMRAMMAAMEAAPMSGDPDRDFLAMMIPHHQGAIDMARLVLVHGRDPLTRQLAGEIIASQGAEIASMQARLEVLEHGPADRDRSFPALSGTRGR